MTKEHQNYIDRFNEIGKPYLESYGFSVSEPEFKESGQQLNIEISKEHFPKYRFSFATNHLDYNLGVMIEEIVDDPWNKFVMRLPKNISRMKINLYAYTGTVLDKEILRLVRDFNNYIWKKQSLGGEPFDYCLQTASDQTCSCGESNLTFLKERTLNNKQDFYYSCNDCSGYWKKSVVDEKVVWLKVGEHADYLYEDPDHPIDFNERKYFPLTFFFVQEAIDLGMPFACGRLDKIDSYYGLSCAVSNLEQVHQYFFEDHGATYLKKAIFRCKECNTIYNIEEEFDSHHGTHRACKKISEEESEALKVKADIPSSDKLQNPVQVKKNWWQSIFRAKK